MAGRIWIGPYKPLGVTSQPVPSGGYISVDASAGNFGPSPWMQVGLQAAEGAAGIATVVSEHLAGDNEAIVKGADARLGETEQALLFDPQTGYLNLQGQEALKQAPTVLDAYHEAQAREMVALTDDDQRQMLQNLVDRRLASFTTQIEHHSLAERQRWYDQASEQRIAQMRADAGLNWSDDALLRRALGTVRAEVREKAKRHAWDSAVTEKALHQQTSRTLVSAIEAAVERNPERARSLRTRYDQHIEAGDRTALDALLTEAQTRQRAQQASAEILNTTPPDSQAPTLQWHLQQADAIAEPDVRTATIRILHANAATAQARARALAEQVLARVLKDGLTDPSQIPVREWVALDAAHRAAIEARIDHNAAGTEPALNPALVDELATQMTEAPSVFARRDLVPSIAHHPLPQWQRFRDLQAGIRTNDPVTEAEVHAIKRGLQLANKMLPADTPDDVATNYRAELGEEIGTWSRISGTSPDDSEIAAMLRRRLPIGLPNAQPIQSRDRLRRSLGSSRPDMDFEERLRRPLQIDPLADLIPGGGGGGSRVAGGGGGPRTPGPVSAGRNPTAAGPMAVAVAGPLEVQQERALMHQKQPAAEPLVPEYLLLPSPLQSLWQHLPSPAPPPETSLVASQVAGRPRRLAPPMNITT